MQQDIPTERDASLAEATQGRQNGVPGIWLAAMMTIFCFVISGAWLASDPTTASTSAGDFVPSELAQVADNDIDGALGTMSGDSGFLAQFKQRADGCQRPLAWVSLAGGSAQPPAKIRLQSGSYFSPVFDVTDVPVRVAIPYPAPYEAGRGTLTAIDVGGSAVIALMPAWRVLGRNAGITHQVLWHPNKRCQ